MTPDTPSRTNAAGPLLAPDEPAAFRVENESGSADIVIVADHAGRAIPRALGDLGLPPLAMDLHVAYDIGVDRLATRLAELLDAPAVIHGYSRLVIDPNRRLDDPTSICPISDAVRVPGNHGLSAADRAHRADALFHPYHQEIERRLASAIEAGRRPALVSVHSFTPIMAGFERPWHVGILWGEDGRIALPLMEALRAQGLTVGDNLPYSGRDKHGYTVDRHAYPRGLPNVLIEVRQDLIADAASSGRWAERLAPPIAEIVGGLE